jgi:hypothetical protein
LVSGPAGTDDHIFVLSRAFTCFEMGPSLRQEERSDYYWSLPSTAGLTVGSGKFLLVLASTFILGSESRGTHHILLSHDSGSRATLTPDSLTGSVGSGKLLLAFASTVILGSESRGTHDHILLSHDSGSRAPLTLTELAGW